jgi:hypothetical protein
MSYKWCSKRQSRYDLSQWHTLAIMFDRTLGLATIAHYSQFPAHDEVQQRTCPRSTVRIKIVSQRSILHDKNDTSLHVLE